MRDRLAGQNENGENCTFLAKPVISVDVSVKSVFQLLAILQVKKWGEMDRTCDKMGEKRKAQVKKWGKMGGDK